MNELLDLIQQWGSLIAFLLNAGLMGVLYYLRKSFVSHEDYAAGKERLNSRLDELELQLSGLENRLKAMPSAQEMQKMLVGQTRLEGKIDAVSASLKGMDRNVGMILNAHMPHHGARGGQ